MLFKKKKKVEELKQDSNNHTKTNIKFIDKDKNEVGLSVEKLTLSNTISIEALIEVLAKKGLIEKSDVLEEVKKIGQHTNYEEKMKK